jgi:hypothetical protein
MKINPYGRMIKVEKSEDGWEVFYLSPDGKMRPAYDPVIPDSITESAIQIYRKDLKLTSGGGG